jgi:hypothetical protein
MRTKDTDSLGDGQRGRGNSGNPLSQLLPLIQSQGIRSLPGIGFLGTQVRVLSWVVDTVIDCHTAVGGVLEHARQNLQEIGADLLARTPDSDSTADEDDEW